METVEKHLGLVYREAFHLAKRTPFPVLDELISEGTLALIATLPRYDSTQGVAPSTFLVPRIRGAMLDYLRRIGAGTRRTRQCQKLLARTREFLAQRLLRKPTQSEIAEALGISLEELAEWRRSIVEGYEFHLRTNTSDEPLQPNETDEPGFEPPDLVERSEEHTRIWRALRNLPQRMRTIVVLYYWEDLNDREIGEILQLPTSTIHYSRRVAEKRLGEVLRVLSV